MEMNKRQKEKKRICCCQKQKTLDHLTDLQLIANLILHEFIFISTKPCFNSCPFNNDDQLASSTYYNLRISNKSSSRIPNLCDACMHDAYDVHIEPRSKGQ